MSESPVLYVCLTSLYFAFTEPQLEGKLRICQNINHMEYPD